MPTSKIGWLNFLLLQFLFFRVYKAFDDPPHCTNVVGYGIYFPILPLTGWWNSFIPLPKQVLHIKLWSAKCRR